MTRMTYVICFLLLTAFLISCLGGLKLHHTDGPQISFLQSDSTAALLRRDGIYSSHDTTMGVNVKKRAYEMYLVRSPLVIVNENKLFWLESMGSYDSSLLKFDYYKDYPPNWMGDYSVFKDTIKAKIPVIFGGGGVSKLYEAYFQGIIKNRDTILDWHMIPPYPKVNEKTNHYFKFEKANKLMYFMENKEMMAMDSVYQAHSKALAEKNEK